MAQVEGDIVGHLLCYIQHRRHGAPQQVLVYEIGVRSAWRRQGVGRALVDKLKEHMAAIDAAEAWVLADATAVDFYRACGFVPDRVQPFQMTLRSSGHTAVADAGSDS